MLSSNRKRKIFYIIFYIHNEGPSPWNGLLAHNIVGDVLKEKWELPISRGWQWWSHPVSPCQHVMTYCGLLG